MTILTVPTSTDPDLPYYVQRTELDGREYVLALDWNHRDEHWYLGLRDENGSSIVEGIKCVVEWPLLRRVIDPRRPPGELLIVDGSGAKDDPRRTDFGTRCLLYYYDAAELGR